MGDQHGEIVVTVDPETIQSLMSSGTSRTVVDTDAEITVTLRCEDSLQFETVIVDD